MISSERSQDTNNDDIAGVAESSNNSTYAHISRKDHSTNDAQSISNSSLPSVNPYLQSYDYISGRLLSPDPVIIETPRKPQCFDHGCNGRTFSTFSNLLRHQREKAGSSYKSVCHRCGAEFTRKTARDGHIAHDKCIFSCVGKNSNEQNKIPKSDDGRGSMHRSPMSPLVSQEKRNAPENALEHQQQALIDDENVWQSSRDRSSGQSENKTLEHLSISKTPPTSMVTDKRLEISEGISFEESNVDDPAYRRSSENAAIEQSFSDQKSRRSSVIAALCQEQRSCIACKIALYGQWLKEHHTEPPYAIWQNNFNVHSSRQDTLSLFDTARMHIERFSGQSWDWWPLAPPRRPIEQGKVRIQWVCVRSRRLIVILDN